MPTPTIQSCLLLAVLSSACATTHIAPSTPSSGGLTRATAPLASRQDSSTGADRSVFEVMLGARAMTNGDWDVDSAGYQIDLSEQSVFGLGGANIPADGSIGTEWALMYAQGSDSDKVGGTKVTLDASTIEAGFGVRKSFVLDGSPILPYVGGGLGVLTTIIDASGEAQGQSASIAESDTAVGVYLHAGVSFALGDAFSLGVDYRILTGASYLDSLDGLDADYSQFMFVLGFTN